MPVYVQATNQACTSTGTYYSQAACTDTTGTYILALDAAANQIQIIATGGSGGSIYYSQLATTTSSILQSFMSDLWDGRAVIAERARLHRETERLRLEEEARVRRAAEDARKAEARDRAQALLLSHLSEAQRRTMVEHRWFVVEGSRTRRKYRISCLGSAAGNVLELNDNDNQVDATLCCHVPHDAGLPYADHWLAQKLMIESCEDDFIRLANRSAAR